jgi:hypothetical protein
MPHVIKTQNASVETLGKWSNRDGLFVDSGKLMIGPDSTWRAGDRHQNTVSPRASLILMSGATFHIWRNKPRRFDLDVYGKLLAGTPERPLTTDAFFPLSFKSRGRWKWRGEPYGDERDVGLMVRPEGGLAVHSADPERARLVFSLHPDLKEGEDPEKRGLKVHMCLLGNAKLDGVEFNDVDRSGIELADLASREQWRNVFYGAGNGGGPEDLFAKHSGTIHRREKHMYSEQ